MLHSEDLPVPILKIPSTKFWRLLKNSEKLPLASSEDLTLWILKNYLCQLWSLTYANSEGLSVPILKDYLCNSESNLYQVLKIYLCTLPPAEAAAAPSVAHCMHMLAQAQTLLRIQAHARYSQTLLLHVQFCCCTLEPGSWYSKQPHLDRPKIENIVKKHILLFLQNLNKIKTIVIH